MPEPKSAEEQQDSNARKKHIDGRFDLIDRRFDDLSAQLSMAQRMIIESVQQLQNHIQSGSAVPLSARQKNPPVVKSVLFQKTRAQKAIEDRWGITWFHECCAMEVEPLLSRSNDVIDSAGSNAAGYAGFNERDSHRDDKHGQKEEEHKKGEESKRSPARRATNTASDEASPKIHSHFNADIAAKLEHARKSMNEGKVYKPCYSSVVTQFLEDHESSPGAARYDTFIVALNVVAILLDFFLFMDKASSATLAQIETCIDAFFFSEVTVRFIVCPDFRGFAANPSNVIDAASAILLILPLTLNRYGQAYDSACEVTLLVLVSLIRLLRVLRRFPQMQLLISAFRDCFEALPVLLYTLSLIACVFTSLIYLVEPRDNIETLSQAAWMVLATITTVGYGDVVPQTELGHLIGGILMILGSMYMAMPLGLIGNAFSMIWASRREIMLVKSTRTRLDKFGFGPYEIPGLFALFDLDDNQEFDLSEFKLMLSSMQIGFNDDDELFELFKLIDKDAGGIVDVPEFIKTLYPNDYRAMYGKKHSGS